MATLAQLEGRLGGTVSRLKFQFTAIMASVGSSIGAELVPATPVDTGYARANWRPSLNAPAVLPISFLDPTGQATVSKISAVSGRYRLGDTIFITNNAPYIGALNAGHSPQADAGFVQEAIERGVTRALALYAGARRVGGAGGGPEGIL